MNLDIGNEIRKVRVSKRISQEKLAEMSCLSTSTIERIENNRINPTFKNVFNIFMEMGVET